MRESTSDASDFPQRLRQIIAEFGSRNALAKSSRIPGSTLQSYEAGSQPGIAALTTLARVANVDLNWLVTGKGQMRPAGLISGALLADFVVVDQCQLGTPLNMPVSIGQVPFSRHFLESRLQLNDPSNESLLVVEADANLFEISRGDLVFVDREQKDLGRDGIYLLDLPGMVLRAVTRCIGNKVRVTAPERDGGRRAPARFEELRRSDLLGADRLHVSKVIGRAVWIGRTI
jgi:hypothetical protein